MRKSYQTKIAKLEKQIDQLARKVIVQKIKVLRDDLKKACAVNKNYV